MAIRPKSAAEISKGRADAVARKIRFEDERPLWRKLAVLLVKPREGFAGLRFAWTGKQEDYWRHEYWIRGSRGMADLIIHKDELIAYYSEKAYERH